MTSLFRELVSVPIALACSSRMTFCPSIAKALHIANPTTPVKQVKQLPGTITGRSTGNANIHIKIAP